jgi:hypothetical protein
MESGQVTMGLAELPPGPELAAALATVDLAQVPNGEIITVLQARSRQRAHEEAQFLAVVAEVGRRDPDAGLHEVARLCEPTRFGADETRCALAWTRRAAEAEHDLAEVLVHRLPLVFAALDAGEIDRPKARVFHDHLADLPVADLEQICRALLPAAGRLTTGQLRVRLARMVIAADPERARDQYERSIRTRAVVGYLNPNGTATITALALPADQAAAAYERLDALARVIKRAGHGGSLDEIRADLCLGLLDGSLHQLSRAEIVARLLATGESSAGADGEVAAPAASGGPDGAEEAVASGGVSGAGRTRREDGAGVRRTGSGGDGCAAEAGTSSRGVVAARGCGEDDVGEPRSGSGGVSCAAEAGAEQRTPGIEVRVQLSTLLGYDEHAGEIPGWGAIPAHVARRVVSGQRGGEWCFAVTDSRGYLVRGGITRRRPHGVTDARDGGVVATGLSGAVGQACGGSAGGVGRRDRGHCGPVRHMAAARRAVGQRSRSAIAHRGPASASAAA